MLSATPVAWLPQGYEQVVLIGHSYGCYLVNRLASEEGPGGRIAALVLIGAGFPQPGAPSLRWIFYLPTWVRFRMPHHAG